MHSTAMNMGDKGGMRLRRYWARVVWVIVAVSWAIPSHAQDSVALPAELDELRPWTIISLYEGEPVIWGDVTEEMRFIRWSFRADEAQLPDASLVDVSFARVIEGKLIAAELARADAMLPPELLESAIGQLQAGLGLTPEAYTRSLAAARLTEGAIRRRTHRRLLWTEYTRAQFARISPVTDAEIDAEIAIFHRAQQEQATRLLRLFINSGDPESHQQRISHIYDLVGQNVPLDGLIQLFSDGILADQNGDQGWQATSSLAPEVQDAIRTVAQGQISPPIPEGGGWALYAVIGRRPPLSGTVVLAPVAAVSPTAAQVPGDCAGDDILTLFESDLAEELANLVAAHAIGDVFAYSGRNYLFCELRQATLNTPDRRLLHNYLLDRRIARFRNDTLRLLKNRALVEAVVAGTS